MLLRNGENTIDGSSGLGWLSRSLLLWQRLLFRQLLWLCFNEFGLFLIIKFFKRFLLDKRDLRNWSSSGFFFRDLLSNWSQSGLLLGGLESGVFDWNELNDGFLSNGKSCPVLLLLGWSELGLRWGSSWGLCRYQVVSTEWLSEFLLNRDGTENSGFSWHQRWSKKCM